MSVVATHPDLHIVEEFCTRARIQRHFADQRVHTPNNAALSAAFPFERLPIAVQSRIWKLLVPYCELIHCLSHLDYLNPPLDNDLNPTTKHFYPSRFHIGDGPCCVALADKPSTYLEYLCVSKRWFYALAHQFYGTNTFAFSSLGELGRFFDGIGIARAERVVHVELLWHGTLAPRQTTGVSRRTKPLAWFMHTSRLRTLLVHINESGNSRMRRPYEMLREDDFYRDFGDENYATHEAEDKMDIFQMEAQRTDLQQNYRKYRSMRTVQGMDYIYQLRGMKWVRFYDTHAEKPCTLIRDKSFLSDITNTTTTKKSDSMALKSEIDNLRPLTLLEDYIPDDQTAELVASFYDDTSVDDVSVADSDMSSSDGSSDSDSDSDSDDDDDSSSGYSSGSSCRVPKGYGRKNKNSTSVTDGGDNMDDDENRPGDVSEPIVIPGDDDNHRRRRRGRDQDISTSDELFVRSGSCTAHTDHDSDDEVTVVTQSSSFVDLTVDDDECYIMDVDDAISVPKEEDEIKTEVLPDDDEEEYLFVKSEESTFQGLSPNAPEFDSDSRSIQSSKRSPSEDNLD
ncbi:hypothetical protein F5Y08DRAFT_299986 [Xylaria arbuscula]|nr:hypothetical protein F5Y08DRAFT_299986 [Xylaria arbuscula]